LQSGYEGEKTAVMGILLKSRGKEVRQLGEGEGKKRHKEERNQKKALWKFKSPIFIHKNLKKTLTGRQAKKKDWQLRMGKRGAYLKTVLKK